MKSTCVLNFGLAGLDNPALLSDFYPDDLPEDWRCTYYSNEFHLLLMSLADLGLSSLDSQTITAAQVFEGLEALEAFADDFSDDAEEYFVCAFDLTGLSAAVQEDLSKQWGIASRPLLHGIHLTKRYAITQADTFECFFTPIQVIDQTRGQVIGQAIEASTEANKKECVAMVKAGQSLEPKALRNLLEIIQAYAASESYNTIHVIFSASQHALSNCRNAKLLGSLM